MIYKVAPARERGLKLRIIQSIPSPKAVAPARERGLKYEAVPNT